MNRPLRAATFLLVLFGPALAPGPVRGDDGSEPVEDAARDAAIESGVRFLDRTVLKLPKVHGTPRKPFTVAAYGMVKLLHGDRDVDRIADFLVDYVDEVAERVADPAQLPAQHGRAVSGSVIQYNWPLAAAAMFFAELQARGRKQALARKTNRKIVRLLLDSQQDDGGWGHGRVRELLKATGLDKELQERLEQELEKVAPGARAPRLDGYPATLVAATNLVGLGLGCAKRAHGAGTFGDRFPAAVDAAIDYFDAAQLASGLFPYDPGQRSAGMDMTGIARSGGAIAALLALGAAPRSKEIRRAADTVDAGLEYLSEGHGSSTLGLLLSAHGMKFRGPSAWKRFRAAYVPKLVAAQEADGRIRCICEGKAFAATNDDEGPAVPALRTGSRAYVTALSTWILLLDRAAPASGPEVESPPTPETTPR